MAGKSRLRQMLKPWDYFILGLLVILSFTPLVIFSWTRSQAAATANTQPIRTAVVSHNGKVVYRFKLTGHQGIKRFRYHAPDGDWNEIEFKDQRVAIVAANCGDQVCVRRGWIKTPGQTIVCLPHKLLIEIKTSHGPTHHQGGGLVTE
ncbi:NusG domain II-containing protein [Loigolactobacillus bifermentans]|uniref:Uncharacterized protein n=1 Tax=Loigolactobacillus bifermentans DSM 20003 TaxID=1423726 RepID=A0A0R1H672_9LACO|nr:NusG domain II-containing protein [Loigolactobacillus bifermentans]KRK40083.1 hypothetical protein FC07_GL001573 [Loigolactobacillus bifermentans DSM 20003]QGG61626.1 NusG domain II-containing protein [Loigolactobacillus bifermentans]